VLCGDIISYAVVDRFDCHSAGYSYKLGIGADSLHDGDRMVYKEAILNRGK
jgi:hypothetical protein